MNIKAFLITILIVNNIHSFSFKDFAKKHHLSNLFKHHGKKKDDDCKNQTANGYYPPDVCDIKCEDGFVPNDNCECVESLYCISIACPEGELMDFSDCQCKPRYTDNENVQEENGSSNGYYPPDVCDVDCGDGKVPNDNCECVESLF